MRVEEGSSRLTSWTGLVFTLIVIIVAVAYAAVSSDKLVDADTPQPAYVWSTTTQRVVRHDDTFSYTNNGLNIAVAFERYYGEKELLDPAYGTIAFQVMSWGPDINGEQQQFITQLQT